MTVADTELKLESQSSTLPRAGRSGKRLPLTAAANNMSGQTDAAAADVELPSNSSKRRSAAHSYRMQTESSLAKKSAGKDLSAESSSRSSLNKKESYTMLRFTSTPDVTSDAREVDESMKNFPRPGCVDDAGGSQKFRMDGHFKADNSSGLVAANNRSDDPSRPVDSNDRTLMPPPLSTSVPLSFQATFIAKAAKHRRTTMPESLARSRELLAGAIAKHHRLSDSSADGDDSPPPSSSSACRVTTSSKQTQDPSPLEPPEKEFHKAQDWVGSVQKTEVSAHNREHASVTDVKAEYSDSVSSASSSVTGSPKLVKIGRCVSPIRPHSASSAIHKRQLPADPRSSVPVTSVSPDHAPLDSATSSVMPQPSMTRSASAEIETRSVESTQNTAVPQSASACHLSSSSSAAVPMQHTLQMQQGVVPQGNTGKRPIASRTQTRLVLDSEYNDSENRTCTAQQQIINEIENFCAERRLSAERRSALEISGVTHCQEHDANNRPSVTLVGHTRQQWEKTKQVEPFILESQSVSSVSQTSSSVWRGDSSALADVSGSSRNSVNSLSSGSCLTYNVPSVVASVSDSVISYRSTFHAPDANGAADANSVQQEPHDSSVETKRDEANDDDETLALIPLRYTGSSGQPLSAISSDK